MIIVFNHLAIAQIRENQRVMARPHPELVEGERATQQARVGAPMNFEIPPPLRGGRGDDSPLPSAGESLPPT
jgi:hypothetical protein